MQGANRKSLSVSESHLWESHEHSANDDSAMEDGFDDVKPDFGVHGLEIGVISKFLLVFGIDLGVVDAVNDF